MLHDFSVRADSRSSSGLRHVQYIIRMGSYLHLILSLPLQLVLEV